MAQPVGELDEKPQQRGTSFGKQDAESPALSVMAQSVESMINHTFIPSAVHVLNAPANRTVLLAAIAQKTWSQHQNSLIKCRNTNAG